MEQSSCCPAEDFIFFDWPATLIHRVLASTSIGEHPLRLTTSFNAKFRSSRRIFFGQPESGRHFTFNFFSRLENRLTYSILNNKINGNHLYK